jgi:DNA-binding response OmpR family regulator
MEWLADTPASPRGSMAGMNRLAMPEPLRLAILDGDRTFAADLQSLAETLGWKVQVFRSTPSILGLTRMRLHVLVVDVSRPRHGLRWLRSVTRELPDLRIVICTGSSTLDQRVSAFRMGVDDWLGKPCDLDELIARIQSVVRGHQHMDEALGEPSLRAGELTISPLQRQVFAVGVSARLTDREFSVLYLLARRDNQVVDRAAVYARVWGHQMLKRDRSVDVHVRRIRDKLKRVSPQWSYIHTHYRVGYRFRPIACDRADEQRPGSVACAAD